MADFMKVARCLGGDIMALVPRRAPVAGQPSPGMVMTLKIGENRVDLEEWFVRVLEEKLNG